MALKISSHSQRTANNRFKKIRNKAKKMALRVASVLLAIVLFAFASVECLPRNSSAKVVVVQNLTTYLMENPEVKILHPLEKNIRESPSGKQLITYADGSRTSGKSSQLKNIFQFI